MRRPRRSDCLTGGEGGLASTSVEFCWTSDACLRVVARDGWIRRNPDGAVARPRTEPRAVRRRSVLAGQQHDVRSRRNRRLACPPACHPRRSDARRRARSDDSAQSRGELLGRVRSPPATVDGTPGILGGDTGKATAARASNSLSVGLADGNTPRSAQPWMGIGSRRRLGHRAGMTPDGCVKTRGAGLRAGVRFEQKQGKGAWDVSCK